MYIEASFRLHTREKTAILFKPPYRPTFIGCASSINACVEFTSSLVSSENLFEARPVLEQICEHGIVGIHGSVWCSIA